MRLSELLSAMGEGSRMNAETPIHDHSRDRAISSLEYDSRHVGTGSAFFAIPGEHTDGHLYIQQAIERGAAAVFCERSSAQTSAPADSSAQTTSSTPSAHPQPVFIEVENCRIALSRASAAFFKNPGDELLIIGVTGTDGKSSTVSFLHQLLEDCSIPAGFISTVSIQTGDRTYDNTLRQSTPEAPDIHRFLRRMLDAGKQAAIVEATSHGLSDKTARLYSLSYDGAIFTNIDHEHLDFHGSFE
ncbi:MAG: Mur ligase family protein, partial [Salinispira sp.]